VRTLGTNVHGSVLAIDALQRTHECSRHTEALHADST